MIAATNRNLEEEVAKNRFRSDLFYRLNVLPISMPPLRAHPEDIPLLVEYFIDAFNTEFRKRVLGATPAAYTVLQALRLARQRPRAPQRHRTGDAALGRRPARCARLRGDHDGRAAPATSSSCRPTGVDLEQLERSLVVQALQRSGGNQTRAGALLGLNRDQIRYRIEKFGLTAAH